jgi:aminomethyltransferase
MTGSQTLRRTPLYDRHIALGARMVEFGGWEMPVQYSGIVDEHNAVRSAAGLFDISHMGEVEVKGQEALAFLQHIATYDVAAIGEGLANYALMCRPDGGIVDDIFIYNLPDGYLVVVNAANTEKDFAWMLDQIAGFDVVLTNISDHASMLALQGPKAESILAKVADQDTASLPFHGVATAMLLGDIPAIVARTGYTGEDGFELYCRAGDAETLWHALVGAGRAEPVGLGARDTLRLEAGLPLYGNDIDDTTTPYEAGLSFIVKLDKGAPFTGLDALKRQKLEGVKRRLVGFKLTEPKTIARHGYPVFLDGTQVDIVRSGTLTPTVNAAIGTTYLPADRAKAGTKIEIDVRGKRVAAETVRLPFVPHRVIS